MGTGSGRSARRRSPASRPWNCCSRRRPPRCGAAADAAARGTRPRAPRVTLRTGWTHLCTRPWYIRVIGQAALTGAHRWILHDSLDECGEADEVLLEMKDQFCAGIQFFQCRRLVLEYIPLILVKSQKFLETTDVCLQYMHVKQAHKHQWKPCFYLPVSEDTVNQDNTYLCKRSNREKN